jgi:hypothetical protein
MGGILQALWEQCGRGMNKETCKCEEFKEWYCDADIEIRTGDIIEMGTYVFSYHDWDREYYPLRFCPFCGLRITIEVIDSASGHCYICGKNI